jgi:hypothetical protein
MIETITTPVGRLVEGSLYKGNEFDVDNQPLKFKTGKNAGQLRTDFYFAIAVPKGVETHWNQTAWGKVIESVGKIAFPKGQWNRPDFSWKITDGDSTVMNKANRRPCDKEGFAGHWVLKFSRPFSPKIYNADGSKQLLDDNFVNLGDYIQVHASIAGNDSDKQPGIYLNHLMVAFSGYGERIILGPDPKTVGFGQDPLPAGVSPTPLAAFAPSAPLENLPEFTTPASMTAAPPPYPQILNAPAAPPARVMLPAANGLSYEQYKSAGWTDEQMVQNGIMSA